MASLEMDVLKVIKTNEQDKATTASEFLNQSVYSEESCNFRTKCVRKPKIAKNIYEVRNIIKLRKKLSQQFPNNSMCQNQELKNSNEEGNSKVNICLDESRTLNTHSDSDSDKKMMFSDDKDAVNSRSFETQKNIDTHPSSVSDLTDVLKQNINKMKMKGTKQNLSLKSAKVITNQDLLKRLIGKVSQKLAGELTVENTKPCTLNIKESKCIEDNDSAKKLTDIKLELDVENNSWANVKQEISEFCNSGSNINNSVPCSDSTTETYSVQCSRETETHSVCDINLSNCTEKLPIQSNIIDSVHNCEIVKTESFETSATYETVPTESSGTVSDDFRNTGQTLSTLNECVKLKKPSPKCRRKVKISPFRKHTTKKNDTSNTPVCTDFPLPDGFQNITGEMLSTLNNRNDTASPLLYETVNVSKPFRTYMRNVHKPTRTYTRKKLNKTGTNDIITSSFANDSELKISDDMIKPSAADKSELKTSNDKEISDDTIKLSAADKSGLKTSDDKFKPSAADKSELKISNGVFKPSAADERKLNVSDSMIKATVASDGKAEISDSKVNSGKLNISDGNLKISDGKLKISLNTDISSDVLKNSNLACLQLPRNIVLKIVKPATGSSENNDVQLVSVSNVKLVLNTGNLNDNCRSTSSNVNIGGSGQQSPSVTTEGGRASDKINSIVPQKGCSSLDIISENMSFDSEQVSSVSAENSDNIVGEPCVADQHESFGTQKNVVDSTVIKPSMLSDQLSYSGTPEKSQQESNINGKDNNRNDSHICGYESTTERISEESVLEDQRRETTSSLDSSDLLQAIRRKLSKIISEDATLGGTGGDREVCADKDKSMEGTRLGNTSGDVEVCASDGKRIEDGRLRDSNEDREVYADEEGTQLHHKCTQQIKGKVVWNVEQTNSSLVNSGYADTENHTKHKEESPVSSYLKRLKRKKDNCRVEEDIKKYKKRKHKNFNKHNKFSKNVDKIAMRSKNNSKNILHEEQPEKRTYIHGGQQDADVFQEEQLVDGTDKSVKLYITSSGIPKIKKPRIANNVFEVRKIIKMEKKLQHKMNKILENKQRYMNTSAEHNKMHKKHIHKRVTLADLLTSSLDTSKTVVPDFLLPKVYVRPLDLNCLHGKDAVISGRQKDTSVTEGSDMVVNGVNLNSYVNNDNNLILKNYVPNFDEGISQPVIVEHIPQIEHSFPYSLITDQWM